MLVAQGGLTVIARLGDLPVFGQTDVTLEATVYGAVLGVRAVALILCGALYTVAVDPDEVLGLFRRFSFHSALTATLATRMVPVLARDARRLAEAQRCRPGPPPSRVQLMRATTSGVLDRALDVAAALEVRGYGAARRPGASGARPEAVLAPRHRVRGLGGRAGGARDRSPRRRPRPVPARTRRCRAPVGIGRRGGGGRDRAVRAAPVRRPQGDRAVSVLSLRDVTYTYPGAPAPAIADVTLDIGPGELVVLAGGSGSGKSTLLRAANGLVPHFFGGVFAGRAIVAGMDTREHGPGALAAAVGTLFQDPETQVVMGTVRAELALPLENQGEAPAAVARAIEEAALALGIAHLLDRPTAELSGGELQRVALGAALAGRPQLILLDEPTSQLDPVAGDELIALLRRLNEDFDAAIVIAEHRLERCLGFADRAIAMRGGPRGLRRRARRVPGLGVRGGAGARDPRGAAPARPRAGAGGGREGGPLGPASSRAAPGHRRDRGRRRGPAGSQAGPARRRPARSGSTGSGMRSNAGRPSSAASRSSSRPGERVALMGRNGAGKSTLLRHAAGLMRPTRGKVRSAGRVALLLQNPTDYLIHERVAQEASPGALATVGLGDPAFADRHPRDLSGGEKQRLALAIVLDGAGGDRGGWGSQSTAVVCLDEPTRGMDRRRKDELAALLRELDAAVLVATHDPEFVAAFAERVVLLGDGAVIADGSPAEILAGGTYFATETARILGGAGGALAAEEGVALVAGSARPARTPRAEVSA